MRKFINIVENSEQPRIVADIGDRIATIHDLYVPRNLRSSGMGTKIYLDWEANLPTSVQLVKLFAADYGEGRGNSNSFWEELGFDYQYGDEISDYEARHSMRKGVNGNPTPPPIEDD